jgi:hypothetical protein
MNDKPGGDRAPDVTPDIKKIEWWMKNTMSISLDILKLSGYVSNYKDREVVVIRDGKFETTKAGELREGDELRFWPPKEKKDQAELRIFLKFYERMKSTLDSYDTRITEVFKAGKTEKVKHLMMERELCRRPHPGWDPIFNALLDTLRLKASEITLSEMRQIPNSRLFYLYDKERELNNE